MIMCHVRGYSVFFFQMGYSTTRWLLLCFSGSKLFPKKWNWDPTKTVRILAETNGSCSMLQPREGQFFPGKLPSPLHESMISMMYTGTVCLIFTSLINSVMDLVRLDWGTMGQFWQVGFSTMSTVSMAPLTCYTHPNGLQSLLKYPNVICGASAAICWICCFGWQKSQLDKEKSHVGLFIWNQKTSACGSLLTCQRP